MARASRRRDAGESGTESRATVGTVWWTSERSTSFSECGREEGGATGWKEVSRNHSSPVRASAW